MFTCIAVIDDPVQIKNLCECCRLLGVEPFVQNNVVTANFGVGNEKAGLVIELFEQYQFHEVRMV